MFGCYPQAPQHFQGEGNGTDDFRESVLGSLQVTFNSSGPCEHPERTVIEMGFLASVTESRSQTLNGG